METCLLAKPDHKIQEKTKVCFKCGEIKTLSFFYKHPQMSDGYLNKCKECAKKDVSVNYFKNHDYYRFYDENRAALPHRVEMRERYSKTDAWKESHKKAVLKNLIKNKHKRAARIMVSNAVRDGRLLKQPCVFCGNDHRTNGHHCNYAKPLEVVWLCSKHHSWVHGLVKTKRLQSKSFPF